MKTTNNHFEVFKKECEKWIKELGLNGWEWRFHHKFTEGGNLARSIYHDTDRYSTIFLNTDWGEIKPTNLELRKTAFHEVVETGLMGMIRSIAENREFNQDQLDSEIHRIIIILQNVFFERG